MSAVKNVARGVLIWSALGAVARADGMDSSSWQSSGSWYFFFRGNSSRINTTLPATPLTGDPGTVAAPPVVAPVVPTIPPPAVTIATPPALAPVPVSQPSAPSFTTTAAATGGPTYNAFINFTSSGFLESNQLATGNPQAWYLSPTVEKLYGGIPTADQQKQFTDTVLSRVEQTFSLAGLHPSITTDPTAQANHTLSVVSGASYGPNPNAIGITDVGSNGFGFIDKLNYGNDINSLEWAVAHNVSHELMHAFGVGIHPDTTGNYIDSATASWNLLTDPNATFSPAAVSLIQATNFGNVTSTAVGAQGIAPTIDGDQEILASPVPEPSTILVWGLLGTGLMVYRSRKLGSRFAA